MSLIEVDDVSYAYGDGSMALRNVNMKIEKGAWSPPPSRPTTTSS